MCIAGTQKGQESSSYSPHPGLEDAKSRKSQDKVSTACMKMEFLALLLS